MRTKNIIKFDKITEYFESHDDYTKNDYLIILGDAGILTGGSEDRELQTALDDLQVTTLWIDGNHENFDLIDSYPEINGTVEEYISFLTVSFI